MEKETIYCKIPLLTISVSAIVCNFITIAIQRKKNIINGPIRHLLYSLVSIDISHSLLIFVITLKSMTNGDSPGHKSTQSLPQVIIRTLGFSFTLVQLFTQTAIAMERFIAVKFPIKYRNSLSKVNRKIAVVAIWLVSVLLGIAVTFPSMFLGYPRVNTIICSVTYITSMILVAAMYVSMALEIRHGNNRVNNGNRNNPVARARGREERARLQERDTWVLSIAIVGTYFILNTALIINTAFFEEVGETRPMVARPCNTKQDIFSNVAFGLVAFNKVFDPLLYFYAKYRMDKRRRTQIDDARSEMPTTANVNNSGNVDGMVNQRGEEAKEGTDCEGTIFAENSC